MIDSVRILLRRAPARRPDPSRSCAICAAQDIADPLARHAREIGAAIVIDMVGDAALSLPREEGSDPELWAALRAAAGRVGVGPTFVDRERGEIYDDHTPFARAGVPAIDVIDFDYPPFHTSDDTLEQVRPRSLDAVGEAAVELLRARGAA